MASFQPIPLVVVVASAAPQENVILNREIRKLETFEAARQLYNQYAKGFNSINISTFFLKISDLFKEEPPSDQQMTYIRRMVQEKVTEKVILEEMNDWSLSDTVTAIAKLGIQDLVLMQQFSRAILWKWQQFSAPAIIKTFCAYARLCYFDQGVFAALSQMAYFHRQKFTAEGVAQLLCACAAIGYRHEALLQGCIEVIRMRLADFTPHYSLKVLVSLRNLGCFEDTLEELLFDKVLTGYDSLSCEDLMQLMNAQCIKIFVRTLGRLYPVCAQAIEYRGSFITIPRKKLAVDVTGCLDENMSRHLTTWGWKVIHLSPRAWLEWGSDYHQAFVEEALRPFFEL